MSRGKTILGAIVLFLMLLGTVVTVPTWDSSLGQLAQERANQLAQGQPFEHNNYIPAKLAYCGCGLYGEMLGRTTGGSIDLFHAFLRSPDHSSLMLRQWDRMAVAFGHNDSWQLIIVVAFLGDCNADA